MVLRGPVGGKTKSEERKVLSQRRRKCLSQGSSSGGTWARNIAVQMNMADPVGCSESLQPPVGYQSAVHWLCTKFHVGRAASPLWFAKKRQCMVKPERSHRGLGLELNYSDQICDLQESFTDNVKDELD